MRLLAHNMLACNAKVRRDGRGEGRRARARAEGGTSPPAERGCARTTRACDGRSRERDARRAVRARSWGARDVGLTSARDDDDAVSRES